MAETTTQASPRLKARIAGVLYLLIIAGSLFLPFAVAPSGMMRGDAALPTAAAILASQSLYIFSGVAQAVLGACDVGVALIFYELLRPVSRSLALLAAFFRLVFVAIVNANLFNHFAALLVLSGSGAGVAFTPDQLQALAMLFIRLRTLGMDIALVFFGFHCLVAGYLFFRSTYYPRIIGLLLAIGGLGYLANIFASLTPHAVAAYLYPYIMLPAGLAELSLTFWLIIVGVDVPKWRARAAAT